MDGCIMCENTLTTAASQKMLVLLEDVFQVSIVAKVHRALFVCSRCEVNVHFIEGAMKLKKEMEEHLLETLVIAQSEGGGGSSGLPLAKRRRHNTGDGTDAGQANQLSTDRFGGSEGREYGGEANTAQVFAVKRADGESLGSGAYHHSRAGYDPIRPLSYAMKRPRPLSDLSSRASGLPLGLARGPGPGGGGGISTDSGNDLHGNVRPMSNGRLLLPHEPVGTEHGSSTSTAARVYDVDRSMSAAGGSLHTHHGSEQQQQLLPGGGGMSAGLPGVRRRRGYPCVQCGKVLRTRAWLTRHLQSCGSDSPFDDTEGILSDQDSYSEDDGDTTGDIKADLSSSSLVIDTSTPSAMSTPPSNVCACKDCGKTFKRKTWLLKHAMQCVASRVGSSSTPSGHGGGSGMGGPNQVGSALTCGHCGKRYLGRYDKYREHVKQCGLRANGSGLGGVGGMLGGPTSVAPGSAGAGGENACPKCGESVAGSTEDLDKHVAECVGPASAENTVHTCPTCGRCYAKRYDYFLRHVRSCQRGDDRGGGMGGIGGVGAGGMGGDQQALADGEPCVCPRCSKMYRRADHLWQHMEMCRGIPGRNVGPHVCDKCGKTYGTRYDVLQRHVLTCKGIAPGQGLSIEPLLDTTQAAAQRSILGVVATAKEGGGSGATDFSMLSDRVEGDVVAAVGGGRLSAHGSGADSSATGVGVAALRSLGDGDGSSALDASNGRGQAFAGVAPHECGKCGKVYTLSYEHFLIHVSKCHGLPQTGASTDVDSYVCRKCGRDFGREYELYLRHVDACDDDEEEDDDDVSSGPHTCPCCSKTCETYEELWAHAQTCQSRRSMLPEGSEETASAAGQEDDGGSLGGGDVSSGFRASGKTRNICAKCGKCYVLLTCYRKHVAKCIGGGGSSDVASATNGGMYNGGIRRPGDVYGASSGSPSTGSNAADDIENEDEDAGVDPTSPYECDNCGLSFGARRSSFLKHISLCTGAGGPGSGFPGGGASSLHVCNYCGKHFVRLGNYTRHVQVCQYTAGGLGDGLRQLHVKQCDRCLEAIPADQYVSHIERCYASRPASSLLLQQSLGGGEGFAASMSAASALLAVQQQALPTPAWTCPRCKKEFQQSGQYIRHISTCSMEFLKCPKCDFGRYYSDKKDFDTHVAVCRGKVGTSTGLMPGTATAVAAAASAAPAAASSPLPVTSEDDKSDLGPVAASDMEAGDLSSGRSAADHCQLIPSDLTRSIATAYNPLPYLVREQPTAVVAVPSSTMTEAMECAATLSDSGDAQSDLVGAAEFALQEEVVAATDGDGGDAASPVTGNPEGPAASDESAMLA